nr:MAG TPA: hypothetical protein [Caudoviricetes sp.]
MYSLTPNNQCVTFIQISFSYTYTTHLIYICLHKLWC